VSFADSGALTKDQLSGYISIQHQHGLAAAETIQSKIKFEQEASQNGVSIGAYHTDNWVFNAKEFMNEIAEKGQGIQFSGVSAHFFGFLGSLSKGPPSTENT
jgi:hypothetical protein